MEKDDFLKTKINIKERVERFSKQHNSFVEFMSRLDVIENINKALKEADEKDRFVLTVDLFRLWIEGGGEKQEEVIEVFGDLFRDYGNKKLVYTITKNYEQLRIWQGSPGMVSDNHVDSGTAEGRLLIHIEGHSDILKQYLEEFNKINPLKASWKDSDSDFYPFAGAWFFE